VSTMPLSLLVRVLSNLVCRFTLPIKRTVLSMTQPGVIYTHAR